jgi:hypothetical protein
MSSTRQCSCCLPSSHTNATAKHTDPSMRPTRVLSRCRRAAPTRRSLLQLQLPPQQQLMIQGQRPPPLLRPLDSCAKCPLCCHSLTAAVNSGDKLAAARWSGARAFEGLEPPDSPWLARSVIGAAASGCRASGFESSRHAPGQLPLLMPLDILGCPLGLHSITTAANSGDMLVGGLIRSRGHAVWEITASQPALDLQASPGAPRQLMFREIRKTAGSQSLICRSISGFLYSTVLMG